MQPLTQVSDISRIAYGFMASKVLFGALELDVFTTLAGAPRSLQSLVDTLGIASNRLETLLNACISLGLLVRTPQGYANAPASQAHLVRGSPSCYADYLQLQTDAQVYPSFLGLGAALRGKLEHPFYSLSDDDRQSEQFSRAQHNGSLGPAVLLAKRQDFSGALRLLDVAGGSGAFSITLCKRYPGLQATVLDFPRMTRVAQQYVQEAGLSERIGLLPGNALEVDWPRNQDAILFSYLLYCVDGANMAGLMERAYQSLRPGGRLFVHDFMVDDEGSGPPLAALWLVSSMLSDPNAVLLRPVRIARLVQEASLELLESVEHIPEITRLVVVRKPTHSLPISLNSSVLVGS